jgi:para-aminobenzoate synthetase component 1
MGDAPFAAQVRVILKRPLPDPSHISVPRFRARMTKQAYAKAFVRVQRCIRDGEFYQLNLAQRFDAAYAGERRELFSLLARRNPAACMSYFEGKDCTLLSLSPETFVRIDGRRIVTCPIKGTRPRGATPEQDAALREELLQSDKERAELAMITDLHSTRVNSPEAISIATTPCTPSSRHRSSTHRSSASMNISVSTSWSRTVAFRAR